MSFLYQQFVNCLHKGHKTNPVFPGSVLGFSWAFMAMGTLLNQAGCSKLSYQSILNRTTIVLGQALTMHQNSSAYFLFTCVYWDGKKIWVTLTSGTWIPLWVGSDFVWIKNLINKQWGYKNMTQPIPPAPASLSEIRKGICFWILRDGWERKEQRTEKGEGRQRNQRSMCEWVQWRKLCCWGY